MKNIIYYTILSLIIISIVVVGYFTIPKKRKKIKVEMQTSK
jgi:hypothetical protein